MEALPMHRTLQIVDGSTRLRSLALIAVTLVVVAAAPSSALEAKLADPAWDGVKVPEGQQCQKFGGQGKSPTLAVSGVPSGASHLVLEFSDRTYKPMDNGGHGKVAYAIESGATTVTVPPVPGHTMELPAGFTMVEAHQASTWDKLGAYLPPCSGGRGNSYYVTVKAVHKQGEETHELGSAVVELGKY
jgi:hypothetical protein